MRLLRVLQKRETWGAGEPGNLYARDCEPSKQQKALGPRKVSVVVSLLKVPEIGCFG